MSWESLGLLGRVRALVESDLADNISSGPKGEAFHVKTSFFPPDGKAVSFEDCLSTCDKTYFYWQGGQLVKMWREFANGLPEHTKEYSYGLGPQRAVEQTRDGDVLGRRKEYVQEESLDKETEFCSGTRKSQRVRMHDENTGDNNVSIYFYNQDGITPNLESHFREKRIQLLNGTRRTEKQYPDGLETTVTDAKDRVLEEIRDFKNSYHRETHQFDDLGREIEKAEWAKDGSNINHRTYRYVNDSHGNWIRRTELFGSSATSDQVEGEVTVRTIDYY